MIIQKFEDIAGWQKAQILAVEIYSNFKNVKDFDFKDQICRAVVSISNNIAEGFDRNSDAEFIRFLYISTASCSEVRSMLYLAEKLGFIDNNKTQQLVNQSIEVTKIINGLIKSIKNSH